MTNQRNPRYSVIILMLSVLLLGTQILSEAANQEDKVLKVFEVPEQNKVIRVIAESPSLVTIPEGHFAGQQFELVKYRLQFTDGSKIELEDFEQFIGSTNEGCFYTVKIDWNTATKELRKYEVSGSLRNLIKTLEIKSVEFSAEIINTKGDFIINDESEGYCKIR